MMSHSYKDRVGIFEDAAILRVAIPIGILCLFFAPSKIDAFDTLDSISVVSSTKTEESRREAIEAVKVVDRREIERSGARTLEDALKNVPGIVVVKHPMAKVTMQGMDGDYVKILVDGVEMAGEVGGSFPLNLIDLSDVEQIEIVQGAASALHGSDAMGGVINIITRKGRGVGVRGEVTQSVWSNQRLAGQAILGYGWDHFDLQVGGNYDRDDGRTEPWTTPYDEVVDIHPVARYSNGGARSRLTWRSEGCIATAHGSWQRARRAASGSSGMETRFEDDGWAGGLSWESPLGQATRIAWTGDMQSFIHASQQTDLAFGIDLPKSVAEFRDYTTEVRMGWEPHAWHSVMAGMYGGLNTMDGDDFDEERRTSGIDVFVHDVVRLGGGDRWQVVPGLRVSNQLPMGEEPFEATVTPKLSSRFSPDSSLVVRLSYGMGYKRPTLKQKHWLFFHAAPANFMLLGNPELEPEKSHGVNGSVEWSPGGGLTLGASAYANYIHDLITTSIVDENPGRAKDLSDNVRDYIHVRTYVNEDEAYTAGGELSARLARDGWEAEAAWSYLDARILLDGEYVEMEGRWHHGARGSLRKTTSTRTTFGASTVWNGPQLYSRAEGTYTPDMLLVGLDLNQEIGRHVTLSAGIENLLDNRSFEDGDYVNEPVDQKSHYGLHDGRIWRATLKLSL